MKIKFMLATATMLAAQVSFAQEGASQLNPSQMIATALTSNVITFAGLNDVVMVQDEAIIAMETGDISEELDSVMEKLRASDARLAALSDEDLIKEILKLQKQ